MLQAHDAVKVTLVVVWDVLVYVVEVTVVEVTVVVEDVTVWVVVEAGKGNASSITSLVGHYICSH